MCTLLFHRVLHLLFDADTIPLVLFVSYHADSSVIDDSIVWDCRFE